MVQENDKKIKDLLAAVASKKKELGTKPKGNWKTNGLLQTDSGKVNLNTINSTDVCVELAALLLQKRSFTKEACELLGVPEKNSKSAKAINEALDDLKLRAQMIAWDAEKKKLQAMEAQLKDLRSTDAKTEDALASIASSLG